MNGTSSNPPATENQRHTELADPYRSLRRPAIALIVLASIAMVLDVGLIIHVIQDDVPKIVDEYGQNQGLPVAIVNVGGNGLIFLVHLLVLVGSIAMVRLSNFKLARRVAIVSVVPFLSPVVLLGIPFGIWALALLDRREVQDAFPEFDNEAPEALPLTRPKVSRQSVLAIVLAVTCAAAGFAGLTCVAASLAALMERGNNVEWFLTDSRGRVALTLLLLLSFGTAFLVDAARVFLKRYWRRGTVESIFGAGLILGVVAIVLSLSAQ